MNPQACGVAIRKRTESPGGGGRQQSETGGLEAESQGGEGFHPGPQGAIAPEWGGGPDSEKVSGK